jgi:hypothetical protein
MLRYGRIAYHQESAALTLQALQEAYGEVVR